MTQINTKIASRFWTKPETPDGEIDFLRAISFINTDGRNIYLTTDEEGNETILLTPKAARWVGEQLIDIAKKIETGKWMAER